MLKEVLQPEGKMTADGNSNLQKGTNITENDMHAMVSELKTEDDGKYTVQKIT